MDLSKKKSKLSKFELANDKKGIEIIARMKKLLFVRILNIIFVYNSLNYRLKRYRLKQNFI